MDVFYEESSITKDTVKAGRKYKIFHILSNVFLALGVASIFLGCNVFEPKVFLTWVLLVSSWFFVVWFVLFKLKSRFNVNYDYSFVSGELRIARVINTSRRKLVARIQAEDIIQLGDVDNTAFEGLRADPNTKTVFCTSNIEATEGKFFMYILASDNGKKLYVLECREELLLNMMKFVKRSVLESDYVPQEKKKNRP